jgi:hypothetical protein
VVRLLLPVPPRGLRGFPSAGVAFEGQTELIVRQRPVMFCKQVGRRWKSRQARGVLGMRFSGDLDFLLDAWRVAETDPAGPWASSC